MKGGVYDCVGAVVVVAELVLRQALAALLDLRLEVVQVRQQEALSVPRPHLRVLPSRLLSIWLPVAGRAGPQAVLRPPEAITSIT